MKTQTALEIMLKQWDHCGMYRCDKQTAIKELELPDNMEEDCACCELAKNDDNCCSNCIIDWPYVSGIFINNINYDMSNKNHCGHSYYKHWQSFLFKNMTDKNNLKKQKEYAHRIADLALNKLNELYPEDLAMAKRILKQIG